MLFDKDDIQGILNKTGAVKILSTYEDPKEAWQDIFSQMSNQEYVEMFWSLNSMKDMDIYKYVDAPEPVDLGCCNNQCITNILVPDTVTEIGYDQFGECSNLKKVVSKHTLDYVGNFAFNNCKRLQKVDISCTIIGEDVFKNCDNLKTVKLSGFEVLGAATFDGCTSLQKVTIPKECKRIRAFAFRDCWALEYFDARNVTELDTNVFENCANLKEIVFSKPPEDTLINPFKHCNHLELVTIPKRSKWTSNYFYNEFVGWLKETNPDVVINEK